MIEVLDVVSSVLMKGEPDAVLKTQRWGGDRDRRLQTTRYTNGQDKLLPVYNVQLNVFNYLRIATGRQAATRLFLIYFEPCTSRADGAYDKFLTETGYELGFESRVVEVELQDESSVPDLLVDLRTLCESTTIPEWRRDVQSVGRLMP